MEQKLTWYRNNIVLAGLQPGQDRSAELLLIVAKGQNDAGDVRSDQRDFPTDPQSTEACLIACLEQIDQVYANVTHCMFAPDPFAILGELEWRADLGCLKRSYYIASERSIQGSPTRVHSDASWRNCVGAA
jgi:hypothetical protein